MRTELEFHRADNALYVKASGRPPTPMEVQRDLAYVRKRSDGGVGKIPRGVSRVRAWLVCAAPSMAANSLCTSNQQPAVGHIRKEF